jgi:hypothetical protein
MGSLARESKVASNAAADMAAKAQASAKAATGLGSSAGLARVQMLELSHVATSLSGSLIAGQNPLRAFAVELPRIAQAASLGQGGLLGMARAVIGLIAPFLGLAAAAGILAAAFLSIKQNAADDAAIKAYANSLGLTRNEMKKLTDVTVTWGDTAKATFEVLAEKAGLSASGIKKWFSDAFHSITDFGKFSVAIIIAAFVAGFTAIRDTWRNLPGLIGEATIGAANLAVASIEKLINAGIAGLNVLIGGVNSALHTSLPQIAAVSLGRIQNQFSGTFAKVGADISGTFHSTFNSVEATFDQISARAAQNAKDRILAQANELIADREGKAAKAHSDRAKAMRDEADAADKLHEKLLSLMSHPAEVDVKQGDISGLLNIPDLKDLLPTIDQDQLLAGPNAYLEKLQEIGDQAQVTAQIMQDAFGNVGGVFGGMIDDLANYGVAQQQLAIDVLKGNKTQEQAD